MPMPPSPQLRRCVLVFARAPVVGTVKTRLAPHLDPETILALYRCFVEDTLEMLAACEAAVAVHCHPPGAVPSMRAWLGDACTVVPQQGSALGARMRAAFDWAFATGYDHALCMGTDIPEIHPGIVAEAFEGVRRNGCTLGPAADGGYYMIGFAAGRMPPHVFSDDIPWGTAGVFETTAGRLRAAGLQPAPLPLMHDIDSFADLKALGSRTRAGGRGNRRTLTMLTGMRLE